MCDSCARFLMRVLDPYVYRNLTIRARDICTTRRLSRWQLSRELLAIRMALRLRIVWYVFRSRSVCLLFSLSSLCSISVCITITRWRCPISASSPHLSREGFARLREIISHPNSAFVSRGQCCEFNDSLFWLICYGWPYLLFFVTSKNGFTPCHTSYLSNVRDTAERKSTPTDILSIVVSLVLCCTSCIIFTFITLFDSTLSYVLSSQPYCPEWKPLPSLQRRRKQRCRPPQSVLIQQGERSIFETKGTIGQSPNLRSCTPNEALQFYHRWLSSSVRRVPYFPGVPVNEYILTHW